MILEALVLEEGEREITFGGQSRKDYELSIRDHAKTGARCKANFRYVLKGDELDKYKGKLRDRTILIHVSDIGVPYNGVFPLIGHLEVGQTPAK